MTKYIKTNSSNCIMYVLEDTGIWGKEHFIEVDSLELEKNLVDEKGRYNYKYVDGVVVEITDEEKAMLYPKPTQEPTDTDVLNVLLGVG